MYIPPLLDLAYLGRLLARFPWLGGHLACFPSASLGGLLARFPWLGGLLARFPSACLEGLLARFPWLGGLLAHFPSCLLDVFAAPRGRLRDFLLPLVVLVFSFLEDSEDLGTL